MSYADHIIIDGVQYDIRDAEAVSFEQEQTLTDAQKEQARANIGAGSEADVVELKSAINVNRESFINGELYLLGNWVNGNIYGSGGITTSGYAYQVISSVAMHTDGAIKVIPKIGYRFVIYYYSAAVLDASHYLNNSGFQTSKYTIPANSFYTILIQYNPSSSSQTLSTTEAGKAIYIESEVSTAIERAELAPLFDKALKTGKYYLNGDWKHGNISSGGNPSYSDTYITQVMPDKVFYTDVDMVLNIESGYKITIVYYSGYVLSSVDFLSWRENVVNLLEIPAGTYFSFVVKKSGLTTEMDITTGSKVVYIEMPLTQTMVDDIADEFNLQYLPVYWKTEIQSRMPTILAKDALIGNNGDSFVFITDAHIVRNSLHSPALIKYILSHSSVDKVFFGGDLIEKYTGETGKADAEAGYSLWNNLMYGTDEFFIIGNHDNNNYDSTNANNALTDPEIYGLAIKRSEKIIDTYGKTSYCVDNLSQKTRYILLDCEGDGLYSDVLTWMQGKLTELQSGWKAFIMQHRYWGSNTSTVSSQGEALTTAINAVYDSLNCTLVAVIVGHTHTDYKINETSKGYPIIAVNCDTRDGAVSGYTRTAGTVNEQSFDVIHVDYTNRKIYMTRIGAGSDREFSY